MNRPINFRAWLTKEKKMYDDTFAVTESGQMIVVEQAHVAVSPDYIFLNSDEYKLLQYTGLKDKNGKEIYEGDIVKGHWWKKGNTHRHIGRVTYVMNAFKVRGVKQYLGMDDELNPTYEVIGNIYENPELLEVSE